MSDQPSKPVLLTGASGNLGRHLAASLATHGWTLRLTDIVEFPDAMPVGASFTRADLRDGVSLLRLAEGCGAILHFGGISRDRPFAEVLGPNIEGLYHIYEAARRERARVVFASSNHAVGFHERSETIDDDCALLPTTASRRLMANSWGGSIGSNTGLKAFSCASAAVFPNRRTRACSQPFCLTMTSPAW